MGFGGVLAGDTEQPITNNDLKKHNYKKGEEFHG